MGQSSYTTPLFGDRDLGLYSPPSLETAVYFPIRNRSESIKKNDEGQVYEADVFVNTTQHILSAGNSMQKEDVAIQFTLESQPERPAAILAIPSTYGNKQYTEPGQNKQVWAGAVSDFHDIPTFQYFILSKSSGASFTARFDNIVEIPGQPTKYRQDASIIQVAATEETGYTTTRPIIKDSGMAVHNTGDFTNQRQSVIPAKLFDNTETSLVGRLNQINGNNPYGVKWYSYDQSVGIVDASVILRLGTLLGEWATLPNSVLNSMYFTTLMGWQVGTGTNVPNTGSPVPFGYIGTFIASGLPIFTLDSFEQLVRYFQGDSWIAENGDLPPSDWSTNWDIYIKGAQKPDIFVTMKSDKLDEWLENQDENTSGLTKSDIKVEYRYRLFNLDSGGIMGSLPKYLTTYTLVDWSSDEYNDNRDTSYNENVALNYPLIDGIAGGQDGGYNEFSDYSIDLLYDYYAQLEFRLHYGKYKSTWCRYKIGVIGSPSVPDFEKMQNEGVQDDEWQDDSTVTLHYDEYPDGFDPYPTKPTPDLPEPGGTNPIPGINGTGLLTTTYKITDEQAKALGRFLWGGDFFQKLKALNLSPIENIVGLSYMPINIQGSTSTITIGNVDTNINGDVIGNTTPLYTLGQVNLQGRYNSFLDYAPYTQAHIFLPFVGFKPIDPQVFTGKTLKVVYSYDIIAGVCNAMLFANDIYIESHQGNCGIDIPLVASNRAEVIAGLVMSLAGTAVAPVSAGSKISLGASFASDVLGMGSDVLNAVSSFHSSRQGGYSPTCAWSETRECFIVLETPNIWFPSTYLHDYGRPCMTTYTIGQLSGFTVCDQTIDVSGIGRASEEEKKEIRAILTNGFYA